MKLKYQLFIVLLLASAALIALMLTINSVNFNRQFISYVNSAQVKRLEPLIEDLAAGYGKFNSWSWIDKRTWRELLNRHLVQFRSGRKQPPPGYPSPKPDRPDKSKKKYTSGKYEWLTLSDKNRTIIIGPRAMPNMQWQPIIQGGQVVGYVGFVRHKKFSRQIDREFARQQRRNFLFAALTMIGLCALIAAPLASRIIRPLRPVNQAISALSGGDYACRTDINRNDEFGELARNINHLGDTLEQNKAARQRWIAEISHELRTPVAVLQGEIEAIQDGLRVLDNTTVDSLHSEVMRLSRLIDDLHQLSISDLGALDYRLEQLDLGQLLSEFLKGHSNTLLNASINLSLAQTQATILGDKQRICQLLENLLQNTLRYTNAPGSLDVSLTRTNDRILLSWSDSAPGVSTEDLTRLFEPLYRADQSRNRKTSGSGLGLAIVQKIVAAHGGDMNGSHSNTGGLSLQISFPAHR